MNEALKTVIDLVGTKRKLASLLGVSEQSVGRWTRVPLHHVQAVSRITGLSLHDLRPDIYPPVYKGRVVGNGLTISAA